MNISDGSNSKTKCFFCKKSGHVQKDCRKYATWKTKKNKGNKVMVYTSDEEQQAFVSTEYKASEKISQERCLEMSNKNGKRTDV